MAIIVTKFGGSSLADAEQIKKSQENSRAGPQQKIRSSLRAGEAF